MIVSDKKKYKEGRDRIVVEAATKVESIGIDDPEISYWPYQDQMEVLFLRIGRGNKVLVLREGYMDVQVRTHAFISLRKLTQRVGAVPPHIIQEHFPGLKAFRSDDTICV